MISAYKTRSKEANKIYRSLCAELNKDMDTLEVARRAYRATKSMVDEGMGEAAEPEKTTMKEETTELGKTTDPEETAEPKETTKLKETPELEETPEPEETRPDKHDAESGQS